MVVILSRSHATVGCSQNVGMWINVHLQGAISTYLDKVLANVNSWVPGRFQRNFQISNFPANFGHWLLRYLFLNCPPMNITVPYDDKSTWVQIMAWCRQATSITWANVDPDPCCHIASLGHNELMSFLVSLSFTKHIAWKLGTELIVNETYESCVSQCMAGKTFSAFNWHLSSMFHCQWTHI